MDGRNKHISIISVSRVVSSTGAILGLARPLIEGPTLRVDQPFYPLLTTI